MNDGDYLSLWLKSRLRSFGMVSLSWSLSGEFGHATCCDWVSQPGSPRETGLNDTIFNLYCFAGSLFPIAMLSLEGQFNKKNHFFKKDRELQTNVNL